MGEKGMEGINEQYPKLALLSQVECVVFVQGGPGEPWQSVAIF